MTGNFGVAPVKVLAFEPQAKIKILLRAGENFLFANLEYQ
jgi:hypothetical protein